MNIDRPSRATEDRHPPDAGDEEVEDLDLPEQEPPYPYPVIRRASNGAELSTRGAAIHLLTLWEQASHTPMDQLLGEYLDFCSLSPSDRGFLSELCYGGVRLRGSVRFLADLFMDRPFLEAVRTVRSAIAVGTYQRVWLRTPAHAAVAESVAGWKELIEDPKQAARDSGYINAVLRSLCDAVEDVDEDLDDPTDAVRVATGWARIQGLRLQRGKSGRIQRWSIQSSHPPELIRRWLDRYPEEKVRQLLARNNETPPLFIVLKQGRELEHQIRVMKKAGIHSRAAQGAPQTLDVKRGTRVEKIPGFIQWRFLGTRPDRSPPRLAHAEARGGSTARHVRRTRWKARDAARSRRHLARPRL